ncbi:MAG TPA: efflux RND transporter permease subunit [Candidatus Saccharimonadales bacterium]|nr:efflux RND transporter permease subunit [Candidatus Saccharimonadales bacterium]
MAKSRKSQPKDKLLPRLSIAFFDRPLLTGFIWLALVVFGLFSYTTLLKREGFPSVDIPLALVSGTYASDAASVDKNVTKPIVDAALQETNVSTVQGSSSNNFFTIQIQYKEGVDAKAAAKELEQKVNQSGKVPTSAHIQYNVPYFGATGGDILPVDVAVSFYNKKNDASTEQITAKAQEAAAWLKDKKLPLVKDVFVKDPFQKTVDPSSGQAITIQRNFDRFGTRQNSSTNYFNSVIIGIAKNPGSDVIKLDKQVRDALNELNKQPQFQDYQATVSASFAPSIKDNLSELQRVLLEGLLAVLVIGSLVIAIRASIITIVSMITVLLTSLGLLYLIGYSLNVITLFALILGLALIVDDTIIMVEAIDASRKRHKDRRKIVLEATRKISRAMVAATATAAISFAPLLFVGGILGSFIRAIPITIISSLIISLIVALIFIPFFARFVLLGNKQLGKMAVKEVAAGFEAKLAAFIARPMLWARNSRKRLFGVGLTAMFVGFCFIAAGLFISTQVVFNIFPPSKDTNGLALTMNFLPGTTIDQAQTIAAQADTIASETVGSNFEQASYFGTGTAQTAQEQITIISYNKRKVTSPELVKQLQTKFTDFKQAQVVVSQLDLGPPGTVFTVNIEASDRENAYKMANDLQAYLTKTELKRVSGKTAHFTHVTVSSPNQYINSDGKPVVTVSSGFDGDDTTTLVNLAQTAVKNEFTQEKLKSYGLDSNAIHFELGQESENQNSFKTLLFAFPILLFAMYILLLFEFRSFLQPLLIFMAIPFSIFGVMLGLYLTHNAISFFAMLGFFALIGLSIKNTILLTDYANQSRRSGMGAIDAAVAALEERFRPLFATSATAVVALIPLALSSPFWQGLSVVLIFGLLSSTLLVVTVFPYYYLGAEYLRLKVSARAFIIWLVPTVIVIVAVSKLVNPGVGLLVIPLSLYFAFLYKTFKRRLNNTSN